VVQGLLWFVVSCGPDCQGQPEWLLLLLLLLQLFCGVLQLLRLLLSDGACRHQHQRGAGTLQQQGG
jgi:hypothetical protein